MLHVSIIKIFIYINIQIKNLFFRLLIKFKNGKYLITWFLQLKISSEIESYYCTISTIPKESIDKRNWCQVCIN